VLLSQVQLSGFQARLRSFGEAKLNNGEQTRQANTALRHIVSAAADLRASLPYARSTALY
jgi:hypothetical protein